MWAQAPKGGWMPTQAGRKLCDPFQHLARKDAVADDPLGVVEVVDEDIQGAQALLQAGLDLLPFASGKDARDDVKGPGAVDVARFRIDGEGDAHGQDRGLGRLAAGGEGILPVNIGATLFICTKMVQYGNY